MKENLIKMKTKLLSLKNKKIKIDYELMPELIATLEKPPSPMGSFVVWTVTALFFVAVFFSFYSKVDTVATTKGKIIPKENFSIIRSSSEGIIQEINVKEGDSVKKGDVLVSFNSSINSTELETTKRMLTLLNFETNILQEELSELTDGDLDLKLNLSTFNLNEEEKKKHYLLKEAKKLEYLNKVEKLNLQIESTLFDKKIAQISIENFQEKQKLLKLEVQNIQSSYNLGLTTKLDFEKKKNELESTKDQLKSELVKLSKVEKDLNELDKNLSLLEKERKAEILNQIIANVKRIDELKLKLEVNKQSYNLQKIFSPINGKVNKISINNFSGFVGAGTELMTVVPENSDLEAEIFIENKDIGFVNVGQEVEIKLDTFPFQDFGMLKGEVRMISPDTVSNNNETFTYKAYVSLITDSLQVHGKEEFAKSGMTLTGEIKTGRRRVIDFILSPVKKSLQESFSTR